MFNQKHLILILYSFLLTNCATSKLTSVRSPAEINTKDIRKVAIGNFEIGMEVLVTDPNYVIFEDSEGIKKLELVGKITEIDENFQLDQRF